MGKELDLLSTLGSRLHAPCDFPSPPTACGRRPNNTTPSRWPMGPPLPAGFPALRLRLLGHAAFPGWRCSRCCASYPPALAGSAGSEPAAAEPKPRLVGKCHRESWAWPAGSAAGWALEGGGSCAARCRAVRCCGAYCCAAGAVSHCCGWAAAEGCQGPLG